MAVNQTNNQTDNNQSSRLTPEQEMARFSSESFADGLPVKASSDDATVHYETRRAKQALEEPADEEAAAEALEDEEGASEENDEGGTTAEEEPEGAQESIEEDSEDSQEADEEQELPKRHSKKTARDRIHELLAQRHDAEVAHAAEKAQLEARIVALEAKQTPTAPVPAPKKPSEPTPPDPNAFEYGELDPKYIDAMIEYKAGAIADARIAKVEAQRQKEAEDARAAAELASLQTAADKLRTEGRKKYADFDTKLVAALSAWGDVAQNTAALALHSDAGHDILYYLATHPTEAQEVLRKPILEQARFVGRLEAQFVAKAKPMAQVKVPNAPPPVKHQARGASGNETAGAATTDFRAFEALANGRR